VRPAGNISIISLDSLQIIHNSGILDSVTTRFFLFMFDLTAVDIVAGLMFLTVFGSLAWYIKSRTVLSLPSASSAPQSRSAFVAADRYRPMLRLLSDEDLNFVSSNPTLRRSLRAKRRELFRSYLRCFARDYSQLLAGVRFAMAQSGLDRPELAAALAKNRALFVMALYKVEFRLALHAVGVGKVDVSGMVDALEALRNQVGAMSAVSAAA
jgi:hypothetical protein